MSFSSAEIDLQALFADQSLDHRQRVVLQVLVHDRIERVRFQHHRQVVQLNHPHAALGKDFGDVGDERARVLEVVEHRDARDRPGLLVGAAALQRLRRVEVVDDVVSLRDRIARDV